MLVYGCGCEVEVVEDITGVNRDENAVILLSGALISWGKQG